MPSKVGRQVYLDRVALDFPELVIVAGHIGYPWTDAPYKWHVNDGSEVFVVLDGEVDMPFARMVQRMSCACCRATFSTRNTAMNMLPAPTDLSVRWSLKERAVSRLHFQS